MRYHNDDTYWVAQIKETEVDIEECYSIQQNNDGYSSCGQKGEGSGGAVTWENHKPKTLAMSNNLSNTLVIGYPDYMLFAPSSAPSGHPSLSQAPSKVPTMSPTKNPTMSPSRTNLDRRDLSELDKHGAVVIYYYYDTAEPDRFPHRLDFTEIDPFYLFGSEEGEKFGEGVAISASGEVVCIGSPGIDSVQCYSYREYTWSPLGSPITPKVNVPEGIQFGFRVGLSYDGTSLVVAAPEASASASAEKSGAIYAYEYDVTTEVWLGVESILYGTVAHQQLGIKGVAVDDINFLVHAVDVDNTRYSYKFQVLCDDPFSVKDQSSNIFQVQCRCTTGFLAFNNDEGLTDVLRPQENDVCVPAIESGNAAVTSHSFTITIKSSKVVDTKRTSLIRHELDKDEPVPITEKISRSVNAREPSMQYILVKDLLPGYRYTIDVEYYDDLLQSGEKTRRLSVPLVTTCTGDNSVTDDLTGRPRNLQVFQRNGYVMYTFQDNSVCEEGFSFSRSDEVGEFLTDFSAAGVSFTNDYYVSPSKPYGGSVEPESSYSDDLSSSQLIVGKRYAYCVRAIRPDHYMESPYESIEERRSLTSSASACAAHTIQWEASIRGLVTTEPNAGNLPVEDVTVEWFLLDENKNELVCNGCSGTTETDKGGVFRIDIRADAEVLNNNDDFPVKLLYSKTSPGPIVHHFLCNLGKVPCNQFEENLIYFQHLQFDKEIHIYDDTSIPMSGKITVADTDGCVINEVTVCAMHNSTSGENEEIVCVNTDSSGIFILPVVAGATVHYLDLSYFDHDFVAVNTEKDFSQGILVVPESAPFFGFDFEDTTKSPLRVEVVGGKCNKVLGKSYVVMSIAGCEWEPDPVIQYGIYDYDNIPAHIINVEVKDVVEIKDEKEKSIFPIWQYLQGTSPIIRSIDLRQVPDER